MYSGLQQMNESINDAGKFKAIFMGGLPGSGKSLIQQELGLDSLSFKEINTDLMTMILKQGMPGSLTPTLITSAKHLTIAQLYHAIDSMRPLIISSTSTDVRLVKTRLKILKNIGYDAVYIWVGVDLETALERNNSRDPLKRVPEQVITSMYNKIDHVKSLLQYMFAEDFIEIDNSSATEYNSDITDANRILSRFNRSPIKNHNGQAAINTLQQYSKSYLVPTVYTEEKLKSLLSNWY